MDTCILYCFRFILSHSKISNCILGDRHWDFITWLYCITLWNLQYFRTIVWSHYRFDYSFQIISWTFRTLNMCLAILISQMQYNDACSSVPHRGRKLKWNVINRTPHVGPCVYNLAEVSSAFFCVCVFVWYESTRPPGAEQR